MPPQEAFINAMKNLKDKARKAYLDKGRRLTKRLPEYTETGEGIILFAESVLQSAAAVDMEYTIKKMRDRLNGGKIILYAEDGRNIAIVESIIKRADKNIRIESTTKDALERSGKLVIGNGRNTQGTSEQKEIEAVIEFAKAKGVKKNKILAIVKGLGSQSELEDTIGFVNSLEIPVVILGFYGNKPHSFARAMEAAISRKLYADRNPGKKVRWYIAIRPIEPYSKLLDSRYNAYLASLEPLRDA